MDEKTNLLKVILVISCILSAAAIPTGGIFFGLLGAINLGLILFFVFQRRKRDEV